MATIEIGGRKLDVADATIEDWEQVGQHPESGPDAIRAMLALFLKLVGHNDGVDAAWLKKNLQFRTLSDRFHELLVAAGLLSEKKTDSAAGEPVAR